MDSPSAKSRIGWRTLILASLLLGSLAVAAYQYFELRRRDAEVLGRKLAAEATQGGFDWEMGKAWGYYLEALGGSKHPNSGVLYEFEGGISVMATRNFCAFYFVDTHDPSALKQLMNTIAPKIVLGSSLIMPRVDAEWESLLQASNGEPKERRFIDDGGSGFPMDVYLRHESNSQCIIIRWTTATVEQTSDVPR